jgi:hypothetical protein
VRLVELLRGVHRRPGSSSSSKLVMARTLATILAVLAATVAAAIWLLVSSFPDDSNHGYRVTARPTAPLSPSQCRLELRRKGTSHAETFCSDGDGRPWFEMHLRNVGDHNGYPICRITAFDAAAHPLFDQDVEWAFDVPAGPAVDKGTALTYVWYFPKPTNDPSYVQHQPWTLTAIDHYSASCHGRTQSQVPI